MQLRKFHQHQLLTDTVPIIRDMVLTVFAAMVRQGYYGRGDTIKVQSVTDAMAAVSKTIELAGYRSPVYRADNKYNLLIERAVEGWRRDDPPRHPATSSPSHSAAANGRRSISEWNSTTKTKSNSQSGTHWFLLPAKSRGIHTAPSNNTK